MYVLKDYDFVHFTYCKYFTLHFAFKYLNGNNISILRKSNPYEASQGLSIYPNLCSLDLALILIYLFLWNHAKPFKYALGLNDQTGLFDLCLRDNLI